MELTAEYGPWADWIEPDTDGMRREERLRADRNSLGTRGWLAAETGDYAWAQKMVVRVRKLAGKLKKYDTPRVVRHFAAVLMTAAAAPRARARKSHGSGQKSNDDGSGDPDPDVPPRGRLLTPADLARYLGKSRQNIYDLLSKKDWSRIPPPIYVGASPRWRLADVDRWLDDLAERQAGMDRPADYWRLQQPEPAAPPPKRGRPRKAPVSADQKGGAK